MPKPDGSLTAIVVSGGKQYRVAPGDRILVDRITAEPGSSVKIGRVLMLRDGSDIKVGLPAVEGMDVEAKVLAHHNVRRIGVEVPPEIPSPAAPATPAARDGNGKRPNA